MAQKFVGYHYWHTLGCRKVSTWLYVLLFSFPFNTEYSRDYMVHFFHRIDREPLCTTFICAKSMYWVVMSLRTYLCQARVLQFSRKTLLLFFLIYNLSRCTKSNKMYALIVLIWSSHPGPGCSKLTTSLVNETLKFQTLISQICQYFFYEKMWEAFAVQKLLSFFQQKYQCIWL